MNFTLRKILTTQGIKELRFIIYHLVYICAAMDLRNPSANATDSILLTTIFIFTTVMLLS